MAPLWQDATHAPSQLARGVVHDTGAVIRQTKEPGIAALRFSGLRSRTQTSPYLAPAVADRRRLGVEHVAMPWSVLMITGLPGSGSSLWRSRDTQTGGTGVVRYSGPQTCSGSSAFRMTLPRCSRGAAAAATPSASRNQLAVALDQPARQAISTFAADDPLAVLPGGGAAEPHGCAPELLEAERLDDVSRRRPISRPRTLSASLSFAVTR